MQALALHQFCQRALAVANGYPTVLFSIHNYNKKLITRWDSERELFYDDIVHALQNNNIYGSIAEVCYHAIAKIHC